MPDWDDDVFEDFQEEFHRQVERNRQQRQFDDFDDRKSLFGSQTSQWNHDVLNEYRRRVEENRLERQSDALNRYFENIEHGLGVVGTIVVVLAALVLVISVVVCCCCRRRKRGQVIRTGVTTATPTAAQPTSYPTQPANYAQHTSYPTQPANYPQPQPGYPQPQPGYPQPQPGYPQPQPGYPPQSGYQVHPPPQPQPPYQGHPGLPAEQPPSYDAATAEQRQLPYNPTYQDSTKRPL